ncbi:EscU/YscU/HrcU family type III secretion system export apparatus switch protein [Aquamicrobium sp. LC103]|uniref:EscU/YscU/HrcU family type III secretion system export apparatus switch protein n=1 Tax=Aquamicrobium sp. LC103 TaxID=1120658 RepID=UPI00063E81CE|nr:EscU/YscU/HrcU family type III secretion system export apparatus switch protein [Aquamicrobium sp. LC103]TKT69257.1 EscU/YscU/HrcU family type III secretion system export apparatus switch protein [Aquamicrobium sp. LC103]
MAQESEEKRLPASEKKLREGRRKGRVHSSRDLIASFTILAALGYLFFSWKTITAKLFDLVDMVGGWRGDAFAETSDLAIHTAYSALFSITVPLVSIVVIVAILTGILATRGLVFSFEPLKPQFEHINPAKGMQRLFSLRNVVEFFKSLAKTLFLSCLLAFILLAWLQPLFEAPACGPACTGPMIVTILIPLGIAAVLAFIFMGILDVPIQRWLFLRDMRMTKTEYKREQKDLEGDPQIRQERHRLRHESSRPVKLGIRNATLVLVDGSRLVALRYVQDETPVPVIVARGEGVAASELLSEARALDRAVARDEELVSALFKRARTGEYVEPELFSPIVRHLVRLQLVQ